MSLWAAPPPGAPAGAHTVLVMAVPLHETQICFSCVLDFLYFMYLFLVTRTARRTAVLDSGGVDRDKQSRGEKNFTQRDKNQI